MKKQFLSAMLAAMLAAGSVPLCTSAVMLRQTLPGDTDADGSVALVDLVRMQRYLHGSASMNRQGKCNADINSDGSVDVFDLGYLKRELPEWNHDYVKEIGITMAHSGTSIGTPSAVITSMAELEAFLEATLPSSDAPNQYFESDIMSMLEPYDEAFFEENVLCLHYMVQTHGCEPLYRITDFAMEGDTLQIRMEDTTEPNMAYECVMSTLLAQVAIPKQYFNAAEVEWLVKGEEPQSSALKVSSTDHVLPLGWEEGLKTTACAITSAEQLQDWASERLNGNAAAALAETYDADYFRNNVLLLSLYTQTRAAGQVADYAGYSREGDRIVLQHDLYRVDTVLPRQLIITQVTMPASDYHGEEVVPMYGKEEVIDGSCDFTNTGWVNSASLRNGGWVTNELELAMLIGSAMDVQKFNELCEDYAPHFAAGEAAYVRLEDHVYLSAVNACRITYDENYLTVTRSRSESITGDVVDCYLTALWVDSKYAGAQVQINDMCTTPGQMWGDGDYCFYDNPTNHDNSLNAALIVNTYTFEGHNGADFYIAYRGHMSPYGQMWEVASVSLPEGAAPFTSDGELMEWEYTGKQFVISWEDKEIVVRYQNGKNWETIRIPYQTWD